MSVVYNSSKLLQGPADIYVAAFGAVEPALPASAGGALVVPAENVWGTTIGLTQGGTTLTIGQDYSELEADQIVDRAGSVLTGRTITVTTNMAEPTLANLVIALNGGSINTAGNADVFQPEFGLDAFTPEYRAVILDGPAPLGDDGLAKRRRIILRKVLSTEGVEVAHSKEDQTVLTVTFTAHYVSNTIAPFVIQNEQETD